jgi:hypothetical protein
MNQTPEKTLLNIYAQLVANSQELARTKVRNVTFGKELIFLLKPYGGVWLWSLFVISSIALLIFIAPAKEVGASLLTLAIGTFINYLIILINIGGLYVSSPIGGQKDIESRSSKAAHVVVNKISLLVVLPLSIIISVVFGLISYPIGFSILFMFSLIAIGISALVLIGFTKNNFIDYKNMVAVLLGDRKTLSRDMDQLLLDILEKIKANKMNLGEVKFLSKLSENDLSKSQVDIETINFRLAIIAIIISILFSQQIETIIINGSKTLIDFLYTFSQATSQILGFSGILKDIFVVGVYVLLLWWLLNMVLSLGFQLASSLLFIYFTNYRAAFALQQALVLYSYHISQNAILRQPKSKSSRMSKGKTKTKSQEE